MSPRIVPFRGGTDAVLRHLEEVREVGDIPLIGDSRWSSTRWDAVRALAEDATPPVGAAWASVTSGTSGTPRILLRSEESWAASFPTITEVLGDAATIVLPAPPVSSLTLFSLAHARSGLGPRPVFDTESIREAEAFHGTPQGLQLMLDAGAIPSVRTALIGGSLLDPRLRSRAEERGIRVVTYYGAAELSFVALDRGDGLRAFPGVELEVRTGVLWVRSPFTALGYVGTAGPLLRDGDWITVGDLAELEHGVLRLRGRADGAIQTASATIIPEEVEAGLRRIPGVRDAVVFGYPAGNIGSLVAAMVEIESAPGEPGEALTLDALREAASDRLAPTQRPRLWFAGSLPRTAAGKPARAEIVRRVLAGEVDRVPH
ncbi:AMP-binding enzyme [Mycetocola saprophilus]|uniref:AMP-binding enzyme n=1 Tax=Mycetocola saprophilus TaxID=76636 RepID=UPI003BF1A9CE